MVLKFGYWNVRGYGSAIRLIFRYSGAKYEDTVYQHGPSPHFKEPWHRVRGSFGLHFPNLPYLIDGDIKLTQSHAIIRYLGRKFGIAAQNDPQLSNEEMLYFQLNDLNNRLMQVAFKPFTTESSFKADMNLLRSDLHAHLKLLDDYLQVEGYPWLTRESISYVDFWAYEILDRYRQIVEKDCLDRYPRLSYFMLRVESLESLKQWLASDEYKKAPIFGPAAKIGSTRR